MRWKFTSNISDEYRCCGCLHVKTGTLIIGALILMVQVTLFGSIAMMVSHQPLKIGMPSSPKPSLNLNRASEIPSDINSAFKGMDSAKSGFIFTTTESSLRGLLLGEEHGMWSKRQQKWNSGDEFFGSLLLFGACIFITMMLIYGTLKGKPGYLTPFMGLQVFDFCMNSLTIVSYFSYMSDVKQFIAHQPQFPYKDKLLSMQSDWLMLLLVLFSVVILCIKVYMMGVVWSCYKYLTQQERSLTDFVNGLPTSRRGIGFVARSFEPDEPSINNGSDNTANSTFILLPPKYEDITQFDIVRVSSGTEGDAIARNAEGEDQQGNSQNQLASGGVISATINNGAPVANINQQNTVPPPPYHMVILN